LDGNLHFLWKWFESIRRRRENGVDTLKLHHDTLSKTLKKHWFTHSSPELRKRHFMKNVMYWWIIPKITKLVLYSTSSRTLAIAREVENVFRKNASPSSLSSEKYHWNSISRDWRWSIIDVFKFLASSSVFSTTIDSFSSVATFFALLYQVSFATSNKVLADSSRSWMVLVTFPCSFKAFKNFSQISKTLSTKSCHSCKTTRLLSFWQ